MEIALSQNTLIYGKTYLKLSKKLLFCIWSYCDILLPKFSSMPYLHFYNVKT